MSAGDRRIDVRCEEARDAWICAVQVRDASGTSDHRVRVARQDLDRLDPGAAEPTDLVRRSFEFLLAREPKESILETFELPVIGRYFPAYESEIRAIRTGDTETRPG